MIPETYSPAANFQALCCAELGLGTQRRVFSVTDSPDLVMKVAIASPYANWVEYLIYSCLANTNNPAAHTLGQVLSISACGCFLMMERLDDVCGSLTGAPFPRWLSDRKRSAFGRNRRGGIKIRDYGAVNLSGIIAQETYRPAAAPVPRVSPLGADSDYVALIGDKIGEHAGRDMHAVIGYPHHILKVCNGSYRANFVELIVYAALDQLNAAELSSFARVEISRSGKYLLAEGRTDVPVAFDDALPVAPTWLSPPLIGDFGLDSTGRAKIRHFADIAFEKLFGGAQLLQMS